MQIVDFGKCTGCGACVQKCPKQCISWQLGEFGFRYPMVDTSICVGCSLCEKACPIDKEMRQPVEQKAFAAVQKNKTTLMCSTSGGMFSALADYVLKKSGTVYGAEMTEDFRVRHIYAVDSVGVEKLRGSKYVQSDTNTTYQLAEQSLKTDKWVLYTGTPCQIAGLYQYLDATYEKLITADIICHGVGSQLYFDKYMEFAKQKYGNIQELRFRSKEFAGWSCGGVVVVSNSNEKKVVKPYYDFDNYYYSYFLSGDIYRESCYTCKYANLQRQGDFTLGDFWGVEALNLKLDTIDGCSLVLVNTEKGQKILNELMDLVMEATTLEQAIHKNGQLRHPSKLSAKRKRLAEQYNILDGECIQRAYIKSNISYVVLGEIKAIIPYNVRCYLRKHRK